MSTTSARKPIVLKVTVMPNVAKVTWLKAALEKKTSKKKNEMANIPAPMGGD